MQLSPRGRPRDETLFAQLAQLGDVRSRSDFLARHGGLVRATTVARLSEMVPRTVRVDARKALALAEAAEMIARRVRSLEARALGLRAKGNALYGLNQHEAAVAHHEHAVRLFARLGRQPEVGRTLSTCILPLTMLGQYQRAHAAAARAREIFTREGDSLRLARLDLNVGNIYHRQDRFEEALHAYELAYERLLPHRNAEGIAVALGNMAVCLISLNDFPRALETHRRARAFCEEHGMPRLVALADYNIAYLYYFRGQYGRAIEALKATREASRAAGDAYLVALCHLDLAEIYLDLNLSRDAAQMARAALAGFRRLRNRYEAAKSLAYLAIAQGQEGRVVRALALCEKARELFVEEENSVWAALLDLYRALILFEAGRLPEARVRCLAALECFRSSPLVGKAILCRLLLARIAVRTGDVPGARQACRAARRALSGLDLPAVAFQVHCVAGEVEKAAGRRENSRREYRQARRYLETLRSSLRGEELKIAFMKNKLGVFEELVELALEREGRPPATAEAFSYVEQAKSRSLQELLLRTERLLHTPLPAPPAPGAAGERLPRVREVREELDWLYHRLDTEQMSQDASTGRRLHRLQRQVRTREVELLRLLRELTPAESEPLELLSPPSLPLAAIRASLPEEAMLVEYFRVRERLLAFLVTRDSVEVVRVADAAAVRPVVRLLHFQLAWARRSVAAAPSARESSLEAIEAHLRELHEALLAPLRSRLRGTHLVFVPHDLLHYVPFHALHDGQRHLIDTFRVSYAPSATIFSVCDRRPAGTGRSLVLGVPEPHTRFILDEVRAVAARLPDADLHVGSAASAAVLRGSSEGRRFVHIAAHGFFRPDNAMFSGIRLGDGYLTLYDLYNLRLPADLVALSACVTGLNVIAAGDELLGLARGLFRAGAASLLLTLWDVPDRSTAEFMKAFYDRLRAAGDRAAAVREAVLHTRERYPHPIHWAPFVLLGKTSPF